MFLLALTTAIAGTFFGAALYVSLVEHPPRVSCGTEVAIQEFRPRYRRGAIMQGGLSAVGSVLGAVTAWQLHDAHIGINALLLALPIPVTLLLIAPTNRRWSAPHWIRTALGGLAFALFLFRLVLHGAT